MIERAGPFGSGNPEPVIALPAHTIGYAEEVGQAHMRVRFKSADGSGVNAIAFRAAGQKLGAALSANRGRQVHAAGSFALDRWQGEERVQFPPDRHRGGGAARGKVSQNALKVARSETGRFGNPGQHARTDFIAIMKRKNVVGPASPREERDAILSVV